MADVGIRDYLKGRGYKDDEITYNNGNVMLKGKQFYSATPQADGSTYGDPNKLNQAFNNYNVGDALDTFKSNLAKPRAQFSYDAQSDPLYQNALGAAQRSAQTAGNNATVRLGARGIGNSQQALTTENQIQQRAVADVNSNILPNLISQAYGRFQDQQNREDQDNARQLQLAGLYNDFGQQSFNNDRALETEAARKRQEHIDLANMLSQQYGVNVDPKDDPKLAYSQVAGLKPLNMREYEDRRKDTEFEQDYKNRSLNASIEDRRADNARLAESTVAETKAEKAKVEKEQATQKKKMEDEKKGLIASVTDPQNPMQYSEAKKQIQDDLRVGFYTQEEADELLATLEKWAQSAYATRYQ